MAEKKHNRQYQRIRADTGQHQRILATALVLGILGFVPVLFRLYDLMVRNYEYYATKALRNQTRTTQVAADRGCIYDRNMNVLATSRGVVTIYLDPHELKQSKADLSAIADTLGKLLKLDSEWIVKQGQDYTKRYKQIAARVDEKISGQVLQYIEQNQISGIHLEPDSVRFYPYGTLASQVIGFTDASNTGAEGVEAAYNQYLCGSPGKVITTKGNNEMDMPFSYEQYLYSRKGCDVVLTLDATVQACLEKQIQAAIDRYDVQNGGFGIVMNVNTGEILAMATLGNYDPNAYLEVADPEIAEELEQQRLSYLALPEGSADYSQMKGNYLQNLAAARLKQWRNRCISDGYEPGSTFKLLTMSAALDCGAIDLETNFHCSGSEQIPGRSQRLHCWRSTGHGAEKTPQALQNSCNIAFAHIALKMGGEQFYSYIEKFGVLEKTGVDLYGESKGIFFDKSLVTDTQKWGTASLTSGSFGQTFKITPLQLVRIVSAVVNGGILIEPYMVSEVTDAGGSTVLNQEPTQVRRVIREETSHTMRQLMASVVEEGTAKNAAVAGYAIGGKTGTSEKIDVFDENGQRVLDKIVSFVGVAPMDNPEYIVMVALDTPSRQTGIYISGGVMAAPTVGAVMADILPYLGVAKAQEEEQVTMPDLTGMETNEAQAELKGLGVEGVFSGTSETVTGQIPAAGESITKNSQVIVYLGDSLETATVTMPDFVGMTRSQAADAAAGAGLYLTISGNDDMNPNVKVVSQSVAAGTQVEQGSAVTLVFMDTKAAD